MLSTMEMYIYMFLYVIIEAMMICIWEWRERVRKERNDSKEKRTISWFKRRVLKMQKRRKRRTRKSKNFSRERSILLSYLRYLQEVKLDKTAAQERLANENDLNHDLATVKECSTTCENSKSPIPEIVVTSPDLDVLNDSSDTVMIDNLSCDVTQDEPMAGEVNRDSVTDDVKTTTDNDLSDGCETSATDELMNNDSISDDVKATIDDILSVVCETPEEGTITIDDSVTDDVKATIDHILTIVCETSDKTAADKTDVENYYPRFEEETKKVDADETIIVDSKIQPEVIIPEPINRPFLFDSELAAANIVTKPPGPRPLIRWNDFDDVTVDDDVLTGKGGQSWDCDEMFEYNEIHFGYKSSLDKDLSEYTTPLIREDTEEYTIRWERACRLANEIKTKRLVDQATQVSKKKKRNKKAKTCN